MANEEILVAVLSIIAIALILGILLYVIYLILDLDGNVRKLWNLFLSAKPKTRIDKEIAETEKEISQLEKHKKKMVKLADLKKREDELFNDVYGDELQDDQEEYHCYTCNKMIIGLDNFYKHRRKELI